MSKKSPELLLSCIISKIHSVGGDEAVKAFAASKGSELPPMKLTKQEMELLEGGSMSDFLANKGGRTHVHNDCCPMGNMCPSQWFGC